MSALALAPLILVALIFGLALLAFWVWMLVDCLRNETDDNGNRLLWTLVLLFTKALGAAIYYFVRYRERRLGPAVS